LLRGTISAMADAGKPKGRAIFISYRRDDSEGEAGRLFDDLVRAYGDDSVFMDVAGIEPGLDFRKAIDANLTGCGVLLAMIGPSWASITDASGTRRLDNTSDFVRLEIATALARQVAVIPVLVHGAHMPRLEELPDDLKDLRYRNSVELTHARWNSDVALLVGALKNYVSVNRATEAQTVHATIPVQLPPPQPPAKVSAKSRLPLVAGVGVLLLLGMAAALFAAWHYGSTPQTAQDSIGTTPVEPAQSSTPDPKPKPISNAESALLGRWKNSADSVTGDDLLQISIADYGGQIMVQAWGGCGKRLCDWGSKSASLHGSALVAGPWELRNTPQETQQSRSASLSIEPSGAGLQVTVENIFHTPNEKPRENFNPLQFERIQ